MINFIATLVRGTIEILLTIAVIKVFFNYLTHGTLFSKKKMMHKIAKMNYQKNPKKDKNVPPKQYYEYKVWRAERRRTMIIKGFTLAITGIKKLVTMVKERKQKYVETENVNLNEIDFTQFKYYDAESLELMD